MGELILRVLEDDGEDQCNKDDRIKVCILRNFDQLRSDLDPSA